jgi:hypothetical protein
MFEISDKIVCINSKGLKEHAFLFTGLPVEGQLYVVREMDYHPETLKPDGVPGVLLVGIFGCDWYETGSEFCFNAKRFVPLEEYRNNRKDYIKMFREHTEPLPVRKTKVVERELVHC